MENLNIHELFSIFEKGDEEVYEEHSMSQVLSNPFVLMGMVTSGVHNFVILDGMYKQKHPQEYAKVRQKLMFKYFTRLYNYLNRIDITTIEVEYKIGETYDVTECHDALHKLMMYFESIEHYEKCATIQKYTYLLYEEKLPVTV